MQRGTRKCKRLMHNKRSNMWLVKLHLLVLLTKRSRNRQPHAQQAQ